MAGKCRCNVLGLGLAVGITCALGALMLGVGAWLFDWGAEIVKLASSLYIGYAATALGSVIGTAWAFVDGFLGGLVVGWLYNRFQRSQE